MTKKLTKKERAKLEVQRLLSRLANRPMLWRAFCTIVALAVIEGRKLSADKVVHDLRERGHGSFCNTHVAAMVRLYTARFPGKPLPFDRRESMFDQLLPADFEPEPLRQFRLPVAMPPSSRSPENWLTA